MYQNESKQGAKSLCTIITDAPQKKFPCIFHTQYTKCPTPYYACLVPNLPLPCHLMHAARNHSLLLLTANILQFDFHLVTFFTKILCSKVTTILPYTLHIANPLGQLVERIQRSDVIHQYYTLNTQISKAESKHFTV